MTTTNLIKIALVDDDEDDYIVTRDLLSEIQAARFSLDWASRYDDGLRMITSNQYDICLIDYRIGERDGLNLMREGIECGCEVPIILLTGQGELFRVIHPNARVLFTSGYIDDAITQKGLLEEGNAFLQKPYSPTVLTRKVRELLSQQADLDSSTYSHNSGAN